MKLPPFLLIPLAFFLSISVYQTALGLENFFGNQILAWLCSLSIAMIMFVLAYYVGLLKMRGQPIAKILLIYFICSIMSYAGNFNSLYTQFQGKELYRAELQEKKDDAKKVTNSAVKALNNFDPENQKTVNDLLTLKNELIRQIQDPANAGCGDRCIDIKTQIEQIIGRRLTDFNGSPSQQADSYGRMIDDVINNKYQSGENSKVASLIAANEALRDEVIVNTDEVLQSDSFIRDYSDEAIQQAVDKINTIGITTEEFINDQSKYSYTPVEFKNAEMGKIIFSFQSAISNPFAFFAISFFSLLIDWLGLIVIIILAPILSNVKENDEDSDVKSSKNNNRIIDV